MYIHTHTYHTHRDRGWTRNVVPIKLVQSRSTSDRRSVIDLLEDSGVILASCAERLFYLGVHRGNKIITVYANANVTAR